MAGSLSKVVLPASYSPNGIGIGQSEYFLFPYGECCTVPLKLKKVSAKDLGTFICSKCDTKFFSPVGKFPEDYSAIEQIWLSPYDRRSSSSISSVKKIISCWTGIHYDQLDISIE